MAAGQYTVVTPSWAQLALTSQDCVAVAIATAQAQDNIYADNYASIALASTKTFAPSIAADALAAPTSPAIGYGAAAAVEGDEENILAFKYQKYTDSVGVNLSNTSCHSF